MIIRTFILVLLLMVAVGATGYTEARDSQKEIVKAMDMTKYEGLRNRVEGWEKRVNEERHPPQKVLKAIGVRPGMVIGEIGAGRGRYTLPLAQGVGKKGKIIANDISRPALSYLRRRCLSDNISNIEILLGENDDPLFSKGSLDLAFMIWVYHMLDEPVPLLKNLKPALRPGALLVIIDPPDSEIDEEIESMTGKKPGPNRLTIKERIEKGARESGFELVRTDSSLPKDTIYFLRVKL